MCNIAGYVGNRPAAPILIEMMRRQEGWNGGCYTGIATVHEGKIYYAKLTGDLEKLIENTNAAKLPGNIGILHSRTPSGGDDEWAHPFLGERSGDVITAYVANGAPGFFSDRNGDVGRIAVELERAGYVFHSATDTAVGNYPKLSGGGSVHMSDVMAQLIASKINGGMDASEAMDDAFCEMPGEIVGLMLSLAEPDCILWSRINMPMFVGFADHGAYLASAPQAFEEDAKGAEMLPACAGGRIYADRFEVKPYKNPPANVAQVTSETVKKAYEALEKVLQKSACTFNEMTPAVRPAFEKADCDQTNALVYQILGEFWRVGRLVVESKKISGIMPGFDVPVFRGRLKG